VRRLTTQIVRRPWKQRIVNDLDGGFGIQMFGHIAKKRAVHGSQHIASTVDYVREGRQNNFDLDRQGGWLAGRVPGVGRPAVDREGQRDPQALRAGWRGAGEAAVRGGDLAGDGQAET